MDAIGRFAQLNLKQSKFSMVPRQHFDQIQPLIAQILSNLTVLEISQLATCCKLLRKESELSLLTLSGRVHFSVTELRQFQSKLSQSSLLDVLELNRVRSARITSLDFGLEIVDQLPGIFSICPNLTSCCMPYPTTARLISRSETIAYYDEIRTSERVIEIMAACCPGITSLKFSHGDFLVRNELSIIGRYFPNLRYIDLQYRSSREDFSRFTGMCKSLTGIKLEFAYLEDSDLAAVPAGNFSRVSKIFLS